VATINHLPYIAAIFVKPQHKVFEQVTKGLAADENGFFKSLVNITYRDAFGSGSVSSSIRFKLEFDDGRVGPLIDSLMIDPDQPSTVPESIEDFQNMGEKFSMRVVTLRDERLSDG